MDHQSLNEQHTGRVMKLICNKRQALIQGHLKIKSFENKNFFIIILRYYLKHLKKKSDLNKIFGHLLTFMILFIGIIYLESN